MDTALLPTEEQEQTVFVRWLKVKDIPHFRVPNETYTHSIRQKAKNKALGVSPGVPDLFVVAGGRLVAIEMKRKKRGTVTPPQKQWLDTLNGVGVWAVVCRGADEAIAFIEKVLGVTDDRSDDNF